jgi:hypothetical protein
MKMLKLNAKNIDPSNQNFQAIRYPKADHNVVVPTILLNCTQNSYSSRSSYQTPIQSIQNLVID